MFDIASRPSLTGVESAVDQLLAVTAGLDPAALDAASPRELLTVLERLQQAANLVCAAEQTVLAHAITADVFAEHGYTSPSELLVDQLRVDRAEAHTRVRRARRAEPRTTLQGEPLPPTFELLAAAQAVGAISGEHVDQATVWLTRIERKASLEQLADAEQRLATRARTAAPESVAALGREILHDLDPDGPEPRDAEKRRALSLKQATDGLGRLTGTLRPEDLAKLETLLSPLAAPRPENPQTGERDRRGVGQRRYDAFVELLDRLLRSGDMPAHGGIPLTLVVTMDIDDLITRTGTARSSFGTTIPVQRLLEQAAELQIVPVITSKVDGILAYGVNRRIASPGQALALIARDRGCTFPGGKLRKLPPCPLGQRQSPAQPSAPARSRMARLSRLSASRCTSASRSTQRCVRRPMALRPWTGPRRPSGRPFSVS